ncbi:hypothetical protein N7474_003718 [Penicillium riverlandense]|uniref:uncharacterized protein n=1 Tax=Penicillium riverlandense TaxID=1903569 RepID=UPI002548C3E0|nr:uncharacterized protein N7474_003718 [Penicillium riverlandense]KAJ5818127.1 hypothetical protein N7474_003718 [Penicillium riverlandense]
MALVEDPPVHDLLNINGIKSPLGLNETPAVAVQNNVVNNSAANYSTAQPQFELEEHPIDQVRPIKVGVIGAGLAGVTAGVILPAKLPGLDLRIWDKNSDVGGTWFENTYPGVRCDIPAHAYQSGFAPNTQWTEEFAQGHEIRDYWQGVARKFNVYQYLCLQQKVQKAEWLADEGKWKVTIEHVDGSNKVYEEKLDVLINAIGHFNAWKLPDYAGINQYKGALFHSSNWDHTVDLKGKRVALIGNGASGLQVLPSAQPIASHVDHYARNPTWIADSFGETAGVRRLEANLFTPAQLDSFKDPETYLEYRKGVEANFFRRFGSIFKDTPENDAVRKKWTELMLKRIAEKPELGDKIIPDFPLTVVNVDYIQTRIKRFTETGIVTEDGVERQADITICATGANVDHAPPFSIIADGIDLKQAWKKDGLFGFPYTYIGFATPGFPNLLWLGGPFSSGHSGTVPNNVENQVTYIAKLLRKVRSQGIKSIMPTKQAADDFVEYCDKFYPRTVWSANCSSWYNGGQPGGRIHGLFPGSATHANIVRRDPRWEDWEYTYVNPSGNRFAYFGNGWSTRELTPGANLTPHLKLPEEVDLKSYMEGWWDI